MKKIIFFSLIASFLFLTIGYLCCYANTLELDYKVTELKTQISNLEDQSSKLKEVASETKDPEKVKQ
jgi:cell division protein FtsL